VTEQKRALKALFMAMIIAAAATFLPASAAHADPASQAGTNCSLVQLASLDMETQPDGTFAVPVALNGRNVNLLVDTGSQTSSVSSETAREFGLGIRNIGRVGQFFNGIIIYQSATIDSYKLGESTSKDGGDFIVLPDGMIEPSVYGMLGPDILQHYDIEFDFLRGKFNLFQPAICDSDVVYWTKDAHAELPVKFDGAHHIVTTVVLDGKPMTVIVDSGSSHSFMSWTTAKQVFGEDGKNPDVKLLTIARINNGRPVQIYSHPFVLLDFNGVAVKNPDIYVVADNYFPARWRDETQIILGLSVLRQLHVFVQYGKQKLYLTAAETNPPAIPPPAAPGVPAHPAGP
jgi:predicted aspartyl protease